MPWGCRDVEVKEAVPDPDLRILSHKKPDGKLIIVLANRGFREHTFQMNTGLADAIFKGFRLTPDEAGENCRGAEIRALSGGRLSPMVPDMAWEFWEQQ